jgi:predicted nucleic acid-binding protein
VREILVDANVLVSFVTNRNADQQERADALFRAAAGHELLLSLHTISIFEMVFVLRSLYKVSLEEIADNIRELLAYPGVIPVGEVAWSQVLECWPKEIPAFGDAVLAAVAFDGRYDAVATFDTTLRKKLAKQNTASYWTD